MLTAAEQVHEAMAFMSQKSYSDALRCFEAALTQAPDDLGCLHGLGVLYKELGQLSLARAYFERVIELDARHVAAHLNLGMTLKEHLQFSDGLPFLRRAAELAPHYGLAIGQVAYVTRQACNWATLEADDARVRHYLAGNDATLMPFNVLSVPSIDGAAQRQIAWRYAQAQFAPWLARPPLVSAPAGDHGERLRIGYLSADFHEHPTVQLLAGVIAAQRDRGGVEVYGYSYGPVNEDQARQRVRQSCHVFRDLHTLDHETAARTIAADGIDILIDLKGYTQNSRLEIQAQRPAPVIVSWLGYPGTLGHPRLADYIIGDPTVTPDEHSAHYSEKLAVMPDCYQPNDRMRPITPAPSREALGLPAQTLVFCSFNQAAKINPDTFDVWCRLLREVPNSVLWLMAPTPYAFAQLQREVLKRGVMPHRLFYAEELPQTEHLARFRVADIALDTFPYTSHTTASDALWCGVPLVTQIGQTFASRVAASILRAAGLPELVAADGEDYFQRVYWLATQPQARATVRQKIADAQQHSSLFDADLFAMHLTQLLQNIWRDYLQSRST